VFDLLEMKQTVIAKDIEGVLVGSVDGAFMGYVSKDGVAHVLGGDGKQLRTFKPEIPGHSMVFSDSGDRVGVMSEHDLVVYDNAGKALYGMPIKSSMAQFALRGDDSWIVGSDGVIRHYVEGYLVASLPSHLGDVRYLLVDNDLAFTLGGDGSLVMSKANAAQLRVAPRPCKHSSFAGEGIATSYTCEEDEHVYVGALHVGTLRDHGYGQVAIDRDSKRGAVSGRELVVFEAEKPIAKATEQTGHTGAVAFADKDHLIVADPDDKPGVYRWTLSTNHWEQLSAEKKVACVVVAAGGIAGGTTDGKVILLRDGNVVSRVDVGGRVAFMTASGDRKWVAATLVDGGTAIVDGRTGALVRRMEPADALVTAASLDETGDLVIRPGRGTMTIWDRASGEALLFDLDLLVDQQNAVWSADGRIEVTGRQIGTLDIPRERRPAAAILADIACKVPLRVRDGKLEPRTVDAKACGALPTTRTLAP
jgi:hypothetical protein